MELIDETDVVEFVPEVFDEKSRSMNLVIWKTCNGIWFQFVLCFKLFTTKLRVVCLILTRVTIVKWLVLQHTKYLVGIFRVPSMSSEQSLPSPFLNVTLKAMLQFRLGGTDYNSCTYGLV